MPRQFILHAPGVHVGGGLTLLRALLAAWNDMPIVAFLDERARTMVDAPAQWDIRWSRPGLIGRLQSERELAVIARPDATIFAFNSLPPLLARVQRSVCFVHNPHSFGGVASRHLSFSEGLRASARRFLLRLLRRKANQYIVQTPTTQRALAQSLQDVDISKIAVQPFLPAFAVPKGMTPEIAFDFFYPADDAAHKNHDTLLRAWIVLAEQGLRPSLAITLPSGSEVAKRYADAAVVHQLNITDLGRLDHARVLQTLKASKALMFASFAETFGIPLMEAAHLDVPIVAAERDFVRDVCTPRETFDPMSAHSISDAVRRFLMIPRPTVSIADAAAFGRSDTINAISEEDESE